jgi:uncharacterized protein (TIGR02270 family)
MAGVIPAILTEHALNAAFLWQLRDGAVGAPHYLLSDLAQLDDRIDANIDGLRLAGEAGWESLTSQLVEIGEVGEVFAAGAKAFEGGEPGRIDEVVAAGLTKETTVRGLVSALGWLAPELAAMHVKGLLDSGDPARRRVGIAGVAVHRQVHWKELTAALLDPDPPLRARALRAVGELGLGDLHLTVRKGFMAQDDACRFWAAWSAALIIGDKDGLAILRSTAEGDSPFADRALQLALRRMDASLADPWHKKLAGEKKLMRRAVVGAGVIGDPVRIPWLIEQMKIAELARPAGEAFSMITGAHISYDDLEAEKPEGFESGPTENPEDENVAMDADEHLYWPDPERIGKWWEKNKGAFAAGTRYLCGQPMAIESLQQVLREGYQRQRIAAALELAIRQPGQPLFEVRAPGNRQQRLLALPRTSS